MIREGKKLPTNVKKKVHEVVRLLDDDHDVIALYAFGSLANQTLKPLSDLDFGVLLNGRLGKKQRFEKELELIGVFTDTFQTDEIDLINMNDAPMRMAFEILKTGKILTCKNTQDLIDFRERLVKKYLDFKFVQETFDAIFLKGVGYHG